MDAATAFTTGQYEEAYPVGIERYFWNVARNAIIARHLKKAGMANWTLLEIGCGRGILVDYLRRRHFNCWGCELANVAVPSHLQNIVQAQTDYADLSPLRRNAYRGALLCDVIEHLPDPVAFLRGLTANLPNLDRILVTVPARQELWSGWDTHYGHFRRYDLGMLKATLTEAGFKPRFTGYFFHGLYIPAFLLRGGKLRSTTVKTPSQPWLHTIVGKAFQLEEMILPASLPGSSALIVATRA